MKLKEEIVKVCGSKVGEIFSNTQGAVNHNELRVQLSFSDLVDLQPRVFSQGYNQIRETCAEGRLDSAVEFLDSFSDFITKTYKKHSAMSLVEEGYSSGEYKSLMSSKSVEVFEADKKNFVRETMKQIQENPKVSTFFKTNLIGGADATAMNNDQLKEKVYTLSQVGIMSCMMKQYKVLREKDINHFETFFSEDSGNLATSVLYDIQQNGLI